MPEPSGDAALPHRGFRLSPEKGIMIAHARALVGWLAFVTGLAFLAGETGGLIGTNAGWRAPQTGVTIYVETNGFHTGFILPAQG